MSSSVEFVGQFAFRSTLAMDEGWSMEPLEGALCEDDWDELLFCFRQGLGLLVPFNQHLCHAPHPHDPMHQLSARCLGVAMVSGEMKLRSSG